MRRVIIFVTPIFALLIAACAAAPVTVERPPNLVIILADDLGFGDVGCFGCDRIETPNIDALADSGVRFTDGYVAAAVCSPSRAGLMTGRYPQRFGYHFNNNSRPGLPLDEQTLATRLKQAGYATGAFGKWQLGWSPEQQPQQRGFDEFFGMQSGSIYIEPGAPGVESWSPLPLPAKRRKPIYRGTEIVDEPEYLTDALTREAVDFIRRHGEEPFFLYLAHYAPHVPLQATSEYLERYAHIEDPATRIFAAMVSAVDDSVGAVMGTLGELGVADNTLVVFLSDNGCALYINGACSNNPLNGGKRYHLEGGVRVPFVMAWPAQMHGGETFSEPVSSLDLVPTLLAAAGFDETPSGLDGVDLLPYLSGEATGPPHENLFWRAGPNRAVREGRWKLWQVNRTTEEALASIDRVGGLLPDWEAPAGSPLGQLTLLYDLSSDIGEQRNVAADHPEIVDRLIERLDAWDSDMIDPTVASTRGTVTTIDGVPIELIF